MKEELFKGLSKEQMAKLKDCNNVEELLALAKQEGVELTNDQLEAVNGGCGTTTGYWGCPYCGYRWGAESLGYPRRRCFGCGRVYNSNDVKYFKIDNNK